MNFNDFEMSFTKENRKLKIVLAIHLAVSVALIVMLTFQRKYFLYKGGPIWEERPLAEEICRQGFLGVVSGEANPSLVDKGIIALIKDEPFDLKIDRIYQLKSLELGSCKIVLLAEGKILAFKITLNSSDSNPFFYKIFQIDEIPAKEGT